MSTVTIFENIQNNIILQLKQAENRIRICVAWLTDDDILKVLVEQARKGIYVEILILNDEYNRAKSKYFNQLVSLDSKVYLVDNNFDNGIMHHKFCLIDYFVLITGSYNWSNNAKRNNENIIIVDRNDDDDSTEDEYNMFFSYENEFDNLLVKYGIEEEVDEDTLWDSVIEYNENQKKLFSDASEYFSSSMAFLKEDKIDDALTAVNTAISMYPFYQFYAIRQLIYFKQNRLIECCNDFYLYMDDVGVDDEEVSNFKNIYKTFISNINNSFESYKHLYEINNLTQKKLGNFARLNIEPHFFKYDDLKPPF